MRKRMVALILCGVLTLTGNVQVFAADTTVDDATEISPRMENINYFNAYLQINGSGNAEFNCNVRGYSGTTTRIEISAKLQKYVDGSWVTLKTFTKGTDSYSVSLNDSYKVSKGYTYRIRATVHAYSNSSSETRTVLSNEVKY